MSHQRKLNIKRVSLAAVIFITLVIVAYWLFNSIVFGSGNGIKGIENDNNQFFNVSRPIKDPDFNGRILLIDFWSSDYASLFNNQAKLKYIKDNFGSKVSVINVIPDILDSNQKKKLQTYVLKSGTEYPVIVDYGSKLKNKFNVKELPNLILLSPKGKIEKNYSNADNLEMVYNDVSNLLKKYEGKIRTSPLPILLERDKIFNPVLKSPVKIAYTDKFYDTKNPALFISDIGHNKIFVTTILGQIIMEIGSGEAGQKDSKIQDSSFSLAHGLVYNDGILYVADTGNNVIRKVDFEKGSVETLDLKGVNLNSPTDIDFNPISKSLIIANTGTNQILLYNLEKQSTNILADNNRVENDGYFAGSSGISYYNGNVYFINSQDGSFGVLNKDGKIEVLGNVDLGKGYGLGQLLSIHVDDTGVYIANSYINKIQNFDFETKEIKDYKSEAIHKGLISSPSDIVNVKDRLYIADSADSYILVANKNASEVEILNIQPNLKSARKTVMEYLPSVGEAPLYNVSAGEDVRVVLNMSSGWKINNSAPNFLNVFEINLQNNQAVLLKKYSTADIKNGKFGLPNMELGKTYYLQGYFYYCEDKENALCMIKNYKQRVKVFENAPKKIKVDFLCK